MKASRGMGDIRPSKMPKERTIVRKDNPNDVEVYKKGGVTKDKWIKDAIKKPGKLGRRARLAETLKGMKK